VLGPSSPKSSKDLDPSAPSPSFESPLSVWFLHSGTELRLLSALCRFSKPARNTGTLFPFFSYVPSAPSFFAILMRSSLYGPLVLSMFGPRPRCLVVCPSSYPHSLFTPCRFIDRRHTQVQGRPPSTSPLPPHYTQFFLPRGRILRGPPPFLHYEDCQFLITVLSLSL